MHGIDDDLSSLVACVSEFGSLRIGILRLKQRACRRITLGYKLETEVCYLYQSFSKARQNLYQYLLTQQMCLLYDAGELLSEAIPDSLPQKHSTRTFSI